MDLKEYTKGVMRTAVPLDTPFNDQLHKVLGMVTETGELADIFKKNLAYGKEIDWVNVEEELGDLLWYVFAFCSIANLDSEKILERNLAKLRIRYPDKFTKKRAIKRNLKKERETLENVTVADSKGKRLSKKEEKRVLESLGYKKV